MELFDHQKEMVAAATESQRGIIQAPTGAGKTFVQAGIVAEELKKGGFRVVLVKTPRIGLTNQVSKEYTDFLNQQSLDMEMFNLLVHSGNSIEIELEEGLDLDQHLEAMELIDKYADATTSTGELTNRLEQARELNIPFILYTTYHSTPKVINTLDRLGIIPTLCMNDEAHYLVREDFATIFELTRPIREYFFTATLKTTKANGGNGMNNVEKFGELIYSMGIQEAIEQNLILSILPKVLRTNSTDAEQLQVDNAAGEAILTSYRELEERFTDLGAKLLVSVRGAKQIEDFLGSDEYTELRNAEVNILTVHSKSELTTYNGDTISREYFDKLKRDLGNNAAERLIIIHYDILSEGIDVPGLLGVLILRNMNEAKFLQTLGRAVRIYRDNPSLKKYGMLFFPDISDADLRENFVQMLQWIRRENYISSEMLVEYNAMGQEEDEVESQLEQDFNRQIVQEELDLYLDTIPELEFNEDF
tara:strand:- start:1763 stop:3190 length:1428 start_codon:yes stop_codon:yes gene_type:complete